MIRWAALLMCMAGAVFAYAPEASLRPELRPTTDANVKANEDGVVILSSGPGITRSLRPRLRPSAATPAAVTTSVAVSGPGLTVSLRPLRRPRSVEQNAVEYAAARQRGQVCNDPALQGDRISPVAGRIPGCGVSDPVRLKSVAGVALSTASVMDCDTARALKTWVNRGVKPAVGTRGGGVSSLRVAAHYSCRTRNNRPGAKISEHGKGRAIDISAIRLKDGAEISVLKDWGRGANGRALKQMWRAACGPFGTVLGPEADVYHKDHFNFDTARYRSGAYCR